MIEQSGQCRWTTSKLYPCHRPLEPGWWQYVHRKPCHVGVYGHWEIENKALAETIASIRRPELVVIQVLYRSRSMWYLNMSKSRRYFSVLIPRLSV